jgi:hypothetical protein
MARHWTLKSVGLCVAIFVILFSLDSFANDSVQTFTLDGEVYQVGTTNPLLDTNLNITVQILNPGKTCVLYEEEQWLDTSATNGLYNIQVGSNTGASKRSTGDSNNSMSQIFQNDSAIAGKDADSATCAGNSYTPANRDARYMRLIITPSSTGTADILSPDTVVDSVPTAWVAQTLQGKSASEFAQLNASTASLSQSNLESVFSNINYPKLQDLLDGTSTQYLVGAPTATMDWNAQRLTNLGTPASSTDAVTKGYADTRVGGSILDLTGVSSTSGDGKTIVWDQTNNKWVASNSGSVSYLVAGTGLTGGTITSTGTIAVDVGVGANKIVQLTNTGVLPAIDAYLLTNLHAPVTSVAGRTGDVTLNAFDITNLGTAALRDYGVGPNELVALTNDAALPAVDGFLLTNLNASYLQSRKIASAAPSNGNVLTWNQLSTQWEPMATAAAGITDLTGDVTATGPGSTAATIANSVITSKKINASGYAINRVLITDGTDPNIITYANCSNGDILMYGPTGWLCSAQLANVNASAFVQGGNAFGQVATLGTTDTTNLNIITGGSNRLTVTSAGDVGVGYTAPLAKLHVNGSIRGTSIVSDNNNGVISRNAANNTGYLLIKGDSSDNTRVNMASGKDMIFLMNDNLSNEMMRITSSGTVGIGTASPKSILEIVGTGTNSALLLPRDTTANRPAGNVTNGMMRYNTDDAKFEFYQNGAWVNFATGGSSSGFVQGGNTFGQVATLGTTDFANLNVITGGSTRMTVTSTGNVGIGTTNPASRLELKGTTADSSAFAFNATDSGGTSILKVRNDGKVIVGNVADPHMGVLVVAGEDSFSYPTAGTWAGAIHIEPKVGLNGNTSAITFGANDNGNVLATGQAGIYVQSGSAYGTRMHFGTTDSYAAGSKVRMSITEDGNVGVGTTTPKSILELSVTGSNSALLLPRDTTANRPAGNVTNGMMRYNTTDSKFEFYQNGAWVNFAATSGATGGFVQGGNAFGQVATLGTTDTANLNIITGNTIQMTVTSTGNVGIGTTTPTQMLEVSGRIRAVDPSNSNFFVDMGSAGTGNATVRANRGGTTKKSEVNFNNNGTLNWATGISDSSGSGSGSEFFIGTTSGGNNAKLWIETDGSTGIGTITPKGILDISATGTISAVVLPRDTTANRPAGNVTNGMMRYNSDDAKFEFYQNGAWVNYAATTGATGGFVQGGNAFGQVATLGTTDVANINIVTNGTARMTITSGGDVGLRTTTPKFDLDVAGGNLGLSNTTGTNSIEVGYGLIGNQNAFIDLHGDATYTDYGLRLRRWNNGANSNSELSHRGTGALILEVEDAGTIRLNTNNIPRMTVDSSGNVGIGTTAPTSLLEVTGTISAMTVRVLSSDEGAGAETTTGAAYTIPDISRNVRRLTLDANTTVTLPPIASLATNQAYSLTVRVTQDATGSWTLAWAGNGNTIKWDTGTAMAPASSAGQITIYQFFIIGGETTWYASMVWREN